MPKTLALIAVCLAAIAAAPPDTFEEVVSQGQLCLDTGRLDEAASLFERAAALAPDRLEEIASDRAWVYVRMGNDALIHDDVKSADRSFSLAAAIYPEFKSVFREQWVYSVLSQANDALRYASEHKRQADWKSIEKDFRWAISMSPGEADAHYGLGNLYLFQGKNDLAKREFMAALGGKPVPANRSTSSLRDEVARGLAGRQYSFTLRPIYPPRAQSDPGPYEVFRQGPFIIHHHNAELARRVADVLQYDLTLPVLDGVITANDPFPDECNVYIFRNEEEFQATGGKEIWAGGQSKLTMRDGKLVSATMHLVQTTPELTESSAPHELTHVRTAAAGLPFDGIPLWIPEGIASSAESPYKKSIMATTLEKMREQGKLVSLLELFAMREYPKDRTSDIFYGESLAVVESLVDKYGKNPFRTFLNRLRVKDSAEAIREVYGLSAVDMEDMVLEWAAARAIGRH
jgi:hypothetical protein